jgi:hypothetical protein
MSLRRHVALWTTALIAIVLLSACQPRPGAPPTAAERARIAVEVEARALEFLDLVERGEMEATRSFFVTNPSDWFVGDPAVFAIGVDILATPDDVVAFFGPIVASRESTPTETRESRVAVLSRDLALQVAYNHWAVVGFGGERTPTFPSSISTLWAREEGAWRMVHVHQSFTNDPVPAG